MTFVKVISRFHIKENVRFKNIHFGNFTNYLRNQDLIEFDFNKIHILK